MCASTTTTTGSRTPSSTDLVVWYLSECKHNHFNHSRVKKGRAWLSCRDCGSQWRTPHPLHTLCPEFYETRGFCSLGSSCPYLHVHRFKCTERAPTHIGYVGEDRDDLLRECAIAVLTEHLPEQPFPRDVMPQIRALYEARRTAVNIPPVIHTAHFPAVQMPHAAIAVEAMHDQQITEVYRVARPTRVVLAAPPPFSLPLGAPTDPHDTSTTILCVNPATLPTQQQHQLGAGTVMNSLPTAASLLRVTARYVPTQRALRKGRASMRSMDTDSDTSSDGSSK